MTIEDITLIIMIEDSEGTKWKELLTHQLTILDLTKIEGEVTLQVKICIMWMTEEIGEAQGIMHQVIKEITVRSKNEIETITENDPK